MSGYLLLQTFVAWLLLMVGCALTFELLRPILFRFARRAALGGRLPTLVALCWSPVLIATLLAAGCFLPWMLAVAGISHDHCAVHTGHVHLCVDHVRAAGASVFTWALFAATAVWAGIGARQLVTGLRRGLTFQRTLRALADDDQTTMLDAEVPLSVTTGLWRPRIFMTSGLLGLLSDEQQRAVLEHERCHARERHALTKVIAAMGAIVLRPSTRRVLLGEVALACERRSDEAAALEIGDRLEVASTLLATRRALRDYPQHGVLALHGSDSFEARIRVLSDGELRNAPPAVHGALALLIAGVCLAIGSQLHHGVETLLSFFLT